MNESLTSSLFYFFLMLFYIGVELIDRVVIVLGGRKRDSTIHTHVSILPQTLLPFRLSYNIGQSSMCCIVGLKGIYFKVKVTQSCLTLCDPMDIQSPGQNTGVGSCSLCQGIFPTQGSNPGLPHWLFPKLHLKYPWVNFPGGPVVKTRCFHCRGLRFYPWSGN